MTRMQIVGVLGVAAALGAVAGGGVTVLGSGGAETEADDVVIERLEDLQGRVNGLRDAVGESRDALADVRERVVAVELELSHAAADAHGADVPAVSGTLSATTAPTATVSEEHMATHAAKAVRQALGKFKNERWRTCRSASPTPSSCVRCQKTSVGARPRRTSV